MLTASRFTAITVPNASSCYNLNSLSTCEYIQVASSPFKTITTFWKMGLFAFLLRIIAKFHHGIAVARRDCRGADQGCSRQWQPPEVPWSIVNVIIHFVKNMFFFQPLFLSDTKTASRIWSNFQNKTPSANRWWGLKTYLYKHLLYRHKSPTIYQYHTFTV